MYFQKYQRSCCLIEKTINYIKQNLNADLSLEKIPIKNNVIYTKIHPTEYIQSGEFFAVYFLCNLSKVCCALVSQRNYPLIKRKFVFPHI